MLPIVNWMIAGLQLYLALGLIFGLLFVLRGAATIDPAARGATWGFKVAILPAVAALWPYLLLRWRRRTPPPEESSPHRCAARRSTP
ncbi:MAG: hypothetical protein AAF604_13125 [Acidobacteriota bacterium]